MKYQIEYTMEVNGYPGSAVHYWWCDGLADLKMTLETLSKLRKAREIKRAEEIEHGKFQKVMYASPSADAGVGGII